MDILAHGLWSGVVYAKAPRRLRWQAVFWGVAPDLFSFGIFFMQRLVTGSLPWGQPGLLSIPTYVYHLYNYTHSLIVWAVVVGVVWLVRRRFPLPMAAWALHIGIDIFTHKLDFFPTPFLWPLSQAHVDGISWGEPWFMALNYSAFTIAYLTWYFLSRDKNKKAPS